MIFDLAGWTTPPVLRSFCGYTNPNFPALTIDDDIETFWLHSETCFHWIIFDMGETKRITKIRLYQISASFLAWGDAYGLYVYVGDDPADLGAAVWEGTLYEAGWVESGAFEKNGRYVKLVSKSNGNAQRLYEFDAYAEAIAPPPVPANPLIKKPLIRPDMIKKAKFRR